MRHRFLLTPLAYFDAPAVLDAGITPIPGSASLPLQVIANLNYTIHAINYFDGIGKYIGVYMGAAGFEVLIKVVGGGGQNLVDVEIPIGRRISLRSMDSSSIDVGTILLEFMGPQQ